MSHRRIAVVTGSRAEFGLLAPVMRAIQQHPSLELLTIAAGSHLLAPARTIQDVEAQFRVDAAVPMQGESEYRTRLADAEAAGRGMIGFAGAYNELRPDWVLVLGDRIEAFAAAAAASIAGIPVAHIHGGDRAEGIADEAMRHAITKLAHLHLPATPQSAERIIRMGEEPESVRLVGSPAIDGLGEIPPMSDESAAWLGDPRMVILHHPSGLAEDRERMAATSIARGVAESLPADEADRVLWLMPNHDPGRAAIAAAALQASADRQWRVRDHLSRHSFVGLLKRLAGQGGVLVGNSSAGLIEAAAVGLRVVNVGTRQAGRERGSNVIDCSARAGQVQAAVRRCLGLGPAPSDHPYGDGRSGQRIAEALASTDPSVLLRKLNAY